MSSDLTKRHTETGGAQASQANTGSDGGGRGQKVSRERGVATRSKKNPGKRPTQGGNSR